MNPNTMKIGAASMGTLALFATALSLGSGTGQPEGAAASSAQRSDHTALVAPRSSSTSIPGASHDDAGSRLDDGFVTSWQRRPGHGVRAGLVTMSSNTGSDASASSGNGTASPNGSQPESVTITIPHRVTVVMPSYEGGRAPSATAPTYEPGTAPSVERDGRKIVIDPGESGTWTAPEADPGERGTFTPPQVILE